MTPPAANAEFAVRFTSSNSYEVRIADGLDIRQRSGGTEVTPLNANNGRYRSAVVQRKREDEGKFVFVHVDHNEHIVYFVKIDDDLTRLTERRSLQEE
ncbi:MAG: hypothetical protein KIT09_15740 [Bryobacteraceae bacterium]|nr:hypothetical protein [Bryobacteraceae bacterium]